jgi:hypothetical protein
MNETDVSDGTSVTPKLRQNPLLGKNRSLQSGFDWHHHENQLKKVNHSDKNKKGT